MFELLLTFMALMPLRAFDTTLEQLTNETSELPYKDSLKTFATEWAYKNAKLTARGREEMMRRMRHELAAGGGVPSDKESTSFLGGLTPYHGTPPPAATPAGGRTAPPATAWHTGARG